MNTSESEEDFESADEDLDFENDLRSQEKNKQVTAPAFQPDLNRDDNKINLIDTSEDISSAVIVERLRTVGVDGNSVSGNEIISNTEINSNEVTESINVSISKSEDTKTKPLTKKLGTKITDTPPTEKQSEDGMLSANKDSNKTNSQEKKIKPMKLGTRLMPKEGKSNVSVDSNADENKNIGKIGVTIDSTSICQNLDFGENVQKPIQKFQLHDETNLEKGDGWEVEEEDGFEIPATLAKTGDDGIQPAQERIFESEQVKLGKSETEDGWGGWGGWGVGSLLSTASGTVTTFSSHVSAGLSTVIETTVGAPDPVALAGEQSRLQEEQDQPTRSDGETVSGYGGLGSLMSGVSSLGSSVINRGLDTLETIGKKTMEVLQEGDPGLKKKRALLFLNDDDKPILSQILREAKEKADNSNKEKEEKEAARKVHFESLFDDFQGMVHLEALEMLSTQSQLKLQSLLQSYSGRELQDLEETLSQVQDLCEPMEDEEEAEALSEQQFTEQVTKCLEGLRIQMTPTKIIKVNDDISARIAQQQSATEVHQAAILSLAELTAAAMEFYHKSAELVMAKTAHNTAEEADGYVQLTHHLSARVSAVANDFTQLLTKNDPIANSTLITNIFLEASNSSSYIKNACQLLVPILQVGAVAS